MCDLTQIFFLVPISIKSELHGVSESKLNVGQSPLLDLLEKTTNDDTFLLKTVTYNKSINYINKNAMNSADLDNWIVKTLPTEYIDLYSHFCHYPVLICSKANTSSPVTYSIKFPKEELDCYIHLLILFIQYIQLQNSRCKLLYYLDIMTKSGKYIEVCNPQFTEQRDMSTRQLRHGCCFTNLFISKNGLKVGIVPHKPCKTKDKDVL